VTTGDTSRPLPTAAVVDALVRLGRPIRLAPFELRRVVPGGPVTGPALPVRHFGSVDVFLEAFEQSEPGAILVIDNEGRTDEGCIGDLTVAEASLAGIGGIVLWGCHRDAAALRTVGPPVWSLGAVPAGPREARDRAGDPFGDAAVGECVVVPGDMVLADDDGVVFVGADDWAAVAVEATRIAVDESRQADRIASGVSLRAQLGFADYVARRAGDPGYTLRQHLLERGGSIEA